MIAEPIRAAPRAQVLELLLTAVSPLSHHDPAASDDSNRNLFNRQRQFVGELAAHRWPDEATVRGVLAAHPVPADLGPLFAEIRLPEFVGIALLKRFLDIYNGMDGSGVFSGMERYSRLESRAHQAAVGAHSLRQWWDRLTQALQVPIHGGDEDVTLLRLLTLPSGLAAQTLAALTREYRSLTSIARFWHTAEKQQSEAYAQKSGQALFAGERVVLELPLLEQAPAAQVVDLPAVSANSLRHQAVREPGMLHLFARLGLEPSTPGSGALPPGVEALFYNGGNIRAGAKQPSNTFALAARIRQAYPLLDLVGGVTDSFDLGEGRLKVASWLVCRENRRALEGSPAYDLPAAGVSVFDLMDETTLTRQAGRVGTGQMIYGFENLVAGTQVLLRLVLDTGTPLLTQGALEAALAWWAENAPKIGGQSARGFGFVQPERLTGGPQGRALEAYEAYLEREREALVEGLTSGKLGGEVVVCS